MKTKLAKLALIAVLSTSGATTALPMMLPVPKRNRLSI